MHNSVEKEYIKQMNSTPGWLKVREYLEQQMASISTKLASDTSLPFEDMRVLQGQYIVHKSIKNLFDLKEG